jgi:hypothetical protein
MRCDGSLANYDGGRLVHRREETRQPGHLAAVVISVPWQPVRAVGAYEVPDDVKIQALGEAKGQTALKTRGFLNPRRVTSFSFWITAICLFIAVGASILAIWEFTGTDALWRTVATCIVVGAGTLAFCWINSLFGVREE